MNITLSTRPVQPPTTVRADVNTVATSWAGIFAPAIAPQFISISTDYPNSDNNSPNYIFI